MSVLINFLITSRIIVEPFSYYHKQPIISLKGIMTRKNASLRYNLVYPIVYTYIEHMLRTMQTPSLAAGALTYLSFSNLPDDTSSGRARSIRGSNTASPVNFCNCYQCHVAWDNSMRICDRSSFDIHWKDTLPKKK